MKLWVVTEGEYSDYKIVAIFTSEEEAKGFTSGGETDKHSSIHIDEWDTGVPTDEDPYRLVYWQVIDLDTGNNLDSIGFIRDRYEQKPANYSSKGTWKGYKHTGDAYGVSVTSKDHAMKLAVEARQKWLAKRAEGMV